MKHFVKTFALVAVSTFAVSVVHAQSAGAWVVKAGANQIAPQVASGDWSAPSSPGSKLDVKPDTQPFGSVAYMYTDHVSFEALFGLPYKHDVVGAGSVAGVGRLATVKQIAPTVFAQYRANEASSTVRPYVGLGLTVAHFYGLEGSGQLTAITNPGGSPTQVTLKSRTKLALSPQVGISIKVKDAWFVDASLTKTLISNTAKLSTGESVRLKLDPLSIGFAIGRSF